MRTYSIKTHWPRPGRNVTMCGYPLDYAEQALELAPSKDTVTCGSCRLSLAEAWHGTNGGYSNHKCTCVPCTAANTVYMQDWRDRHWGTEPPTHGDNGYINYGCRCGTCRKAHNSRTRPA